MTIGCVGNCEIRTWSFREGLRETLFCRRRTGGGRGELLEHLYTFLSAEDAEGRGELLKHLYTFLSTEGTEDHGEHLYTLDIFTSFCPRRTRRGAENERQFFVVSF